MEPTKETETEFKPTGGGKLIGRGGFADVYLCEDQNLDGKIAVKLYHEKRLDTKDRRDRFKRIAGILEGIQHKGLPVFHGARLVSPDEESEFKVGEPGCPCPKLIEGKTTFGYMVFEYIG